MREVIDDKELYEMELEYWRNLYNWIIKDNDIPLEKDMYRKMLKEKEVELGSFNAQKTKLGWKKT